MGKLEEIAADNAQGFSSGAPTDTQAAQLIELGFAAPSRGGYAITPEGMDFLAECAAEDREIEARKGRGAR